MTAGPVNRALLDSFFQQPGDVYDDSKTEGAFDVIADQLDENWGAQSLHRTTAILDHPDGSVTNEKIANGTLTADKFTPGALTNETQNGLAITALEATVNTLEAETTQNFNDRGVNVKSPPAPLVGAKGDWNGTTGTDDTAAFQAVINLCLTSGLAMIIPGDTQSYLIGDLVINGALTIIGVGHHRPSLSAKNTTVKLFNLQSNSVTIENLFIDMNAAPNTSVVFYFNTALSGLQDIRIRNIRIENAYTVVTDANHATNLIANVHFEDINCFCGKGTAVTFNDFLGFIYLTKFIVDYTASNLRHGINVTFPGIVINNVEGIILQDVDVIGGTNSAGGDGFVFTSCKAIWLNRTMADTVGGTGYKFTTCQYVYMNDVASSLCRRGGVYMKSCTQVEGGRVFINGASGQVGAVAAQDGFYMELCTDVNIGNISAISNTGNGFLFNGCQRMIINAIRAFGNGVSGVKEQNAAGTTAFNILGNVSSILNTTNSLVLVVASTVASNLIPNSGTPQFHVVGPVTI